MESEFDKLQKAVQEGEDILREIKPQWNNLGFPGSVYSPNEFMVCLLLAHIGRDGNGLEALKEMIEAGKSARQSLIDNQVLRSHMGSDELGIIFTTALASALNGLSHEPHREVRHELHGESHQEILKPLPPAAPVAPFTMPARPITACPHCGHDFDKCRQGEYEKKIIAADGTVIEFCSHVDDLGKCTECTEGDTCECSHCSTDMIEARGYKCKGEGCGNIYCDGDDCKSQLNDAGFCGDCESFTCDNCNEEDVETEKMIRCANPDCKTDKDLCPTCGPKLLNEAGLCPDCSDEEEFTCTECECGVTNSRAFVCKDEDCGAIYCVDHKEELNEAGYCSDCREEECADCGNEFPRENMIKCSGSDCESGEVFCPDCAATHLNRKGLCSTCSGEEELTCSDCGGTVINSQSKKCRGRECENVYCPGCAKKNLDSRERCDDCQ